MSKALSSLVQYALLTLDLEAGTTYIGSDEGVGGCGKIHRPSSFSLCAGWPGDSGVSSGESIRPPESCELWPGDSGASRVLKGLARRLAQSLWG